MGRCAAFALSAAHASASEPVSPMPANPDTKLRLCINHLTYLILRCTEKQSEYGSRPELVDRLVEGKKEMPAIEAQSKCLL
jgi:hypothetical protein